MLVENFRPGTLERLGLGPDGLFARQPVVGHHAGHRASGRTGRTIAGRVRHDRRGDVRPRCDQRRAGRCSRLLPPIALTDEVTGLAAAFATMVALHSGVGQVVDVSLLESMFQIMGPLISLYRLTGEQQPRLGAGLPYTVPRGTYRCSDGKWVGLSASADRSRRGADLLGVGGDPRFTTFACARCTTATSWKRRMAEWCAKRTRRPR